MQGKVCIVTGANTGIGKETARALAMGGAHVVIGCRDPVRGAAACAELAADVDGAELTALDLDLASLASVRAFAAEFIARFDRLDVLVNNAGIWSGRRQLTTDGFELTFGVNHLGHFLLTHLLRDRLIASAPARVVTVSSALYARGRIDFDDLQTERSYSRTRAYGAAKLANVLFTVELARRLEGSGVTANVLHPGAVASDFIRELPDFIRWAAGLVLASPERGARTSVWAATSPELAGVSGAYFSGCRIRALRGPARDPEIAARLWEVSADLAGLPRPS